MSSLAGAPPCRRKTAAAMDVEVQRARSLQGPSSVSTGAAGVVSSLPPPQVAGGRRCRRPAPEIDGSGRSTSYLVDPRLPPPFPPSPWRHPLFPRWYSRSG